MIYSLYALLTTLLALLASPFLVIAGWRNWRGMQHRLGLLPVVDGPADRPIVWFHAASVGEVGVLTTIVKALVRVRPNWQIVVSTMTQTGFEHARRMLPDVHECCLVPLDVPVFVRRTIHRLRPQALILVEGELWPCLIAEAARFGCRIALVNGRMSDRTYPRYRAIRPLTRGMLSRLAFIGVQTKTDAERFIACGADAERVIVTGNMKFDSIRAASALSRPVLRQTLGLSETEPIIIAGSTRPGEEERVVDAFIAVRARHPDVRLICAPRHLNRLSEVQGLLQNCGLSFIRWSEINSIGSPGEQRSTTDSLSRTTEPVILLDALGELASLYAVADVAFVGGTLVPVGGHNLLEPAAHGVPVLFGPHTQNVRASAEALRQSGGGLEVHDSGDLADTLVRLLEHPDERRQMGQAAADAVLSRDGAVDQTVALLVERI